VTLSCIPASPSHSCRLCQFQCMAVFTCCFDPVCLPAVCLSVCLPVSVRLSVSLSVHSACLSSSLSVCLSVCLPVCLSSCLPVCLSVRLTACPPAFACLPVYLPETHARCRYDDMVTAQQNMDLQTTILSRFDLIFIVRDVTTREHDARLADHMCLMHRLGHVSNQQEDRDEQVCTPLLTTYSSQACHDQLPHCNLHQLHLGK